MSSKSFRFKLAGIISLFSISTILSYFYFNSQKASFNQVPSTEVDIEATAQLAALPLAAPEKVFNFLLLGQGDPSHEGSQLTDSLMVVHLDTEKKLAALISVPRDTWISLPESETKIVNHKINEAYLVGRKIGGETEGLRLVRQAVTTVTGLPIHYSVFIDFNGFANAINQLGKIEVEVPHAFDDYYYPVRGKELETCDMAPEQLVAINATMSGFLLEKQYTCRYEHLHFDAGKTLMDGETALKFTRSRHSDQYGGDFARAERQQAVLIGIKNKLLSLNGLQLAPDFFEKFSHWVKTDLDIKSVKAIAGLIIEPNQYSIKKVVLSTDNVFTESRSATGQFILVPKAGINKWSETQQLIKGELAIN